MRGFLSRRRRSERPSRTRGTGYRSPAAHIPASRRRLRRRQRRRAVFYRRPVPRKTVSWSHRRKTRSSAPSWTRPKPVRYTAPAASAVTDFVAARDVPATEKRRENSYHGYRKSTLFHNKPHNFLNFNSSELVTTDTELMAIAPPAMIGLSRPSAAIGMPMVL